MGAIIIMCIVAVDFDGTISSDFIGARKALEALVRKGHYIVIWSSRNSYRQHGSNVPNLMKEMQDSLREHHVPFHEIDLGDNGKFHAQVYIDDKAIRFENNWDEIVDKIY